MNCVVMGGGGFIGSHLTEALLLRNDKVTVFDKPDAPYLELLAKKGVTIETGNFLETSQVQKALNGADTVFHLISTTVPKSSIDNPIFDIETNLVGSINLINIAKNAGVKKIVFSSSGGTVYGVPKEIPISEEHPTDPISSYGIVKLAVEKYLRLFWTLSGMNYCILRCSNAYGERQQVNSAQGIISTIIDKEYHNEKLTIWGDGSVIRDYIHVSDIVSAFILASNEIEEPRIFNIGSGMGHSVIDIINTIDRLLGKKIDVVYEHGRAYDVPINILDISRAKKYLGWEPRKTLIDGIRQTLEYMHGN